MKFLRSLLLLAIFSFFLVAPNLQGQSPRLVLLEHFTQASCPPCATWNPTVQALLNANPDKITSVKYQTSWPGVDPMNAQNPQEVASRVGVYGVVGVPYSVIDGNYFSGSPSNWNLTTVNNRYAMSSPLEIQLTKALNVAQDSIFVTMLVKATGPVSGNIGAYIAVVENHIHFNIAPGTNGEKDFYNVMKKMLPNASGTTLPADMAVGDYVVLQYAWKLANVYDKTELDVKAWVQNRSSKEVLQAANVTASISPLYASDGALLAVLGVGDNWCRETMTTQVVLRNQGSQPLTSAQVRYSLNGGTEITHDWTGSLGFMEEVTITLPTGNLTLESANDLKAYIHTTNGSVDDYTRNDTLRTSFSLAPATSEKVYFFMKLDNKPWETTWELVDDQGNVAYSGGPYTNPGQTVQQTFNLGTGCYTFILHDAWSDGICCSNGYGVYQLTSDISSQILGEGSDFGREAVHAFKVGGYSGLSEEMPFGLVSVFPNPSSFEALVDFEIFEPGEVELEVLDFSGRVVYRSRAKYSGPGWKRHSIPTHRLDDGLYVVHLRREGKVQVLKLTVIH